MKRLLLTLLSALTLAGCIEPNSILLLNALVLDDKCVPTGDTYIYSGSVVAGTGLYIAAFQVQSELDPTDVNASGTPANPGSRNDYIAQFALLNYVNPVTGQSLGIPQQNIPMNAIIFAGAKAEDSYIKMNLLNPTVAAAIAGFPQVGVRIQLTGRLVSSNTVLVSNTIQFPLTVYPPGGTCLYPDPLHCGSNQQDMYCY